MVTAGIIAEYNPFHNGHQFHIEETRRETGADFVIAVMSGNFVQRGRSCAAGQIYPRPDGLRGRRRPDSGASPQRLSSPMRKDSRREASAFWNGQE